MTSMQYTQRQDRANKRAKKKAKCPMNSTKRTKQRKGGNKSWEE